MKKIFAVVVTYNRIELLKECLTALKNQTYRLERVIVIDNHSEDGTAEYLATLQEDALFHIVTNEKNEGGSAGFSSGIKLAAQEHPDWIWVMDDDSIPSPDALEQLTPFTSDEKVGFVNSKVVWKDGALHVMNIPTPCKNQLPKEKLFQGNRELLQHCQLIRSASFVSLLIRGDMPWKVGLPFKEFFIWCDDAEYTERITLQGYYGLLVESSVALHKTALNYSSSLYTVPISAAWKVFYGERNESYIRRRRKGAFRFFFSQLNAFRVHVHHLRKMNIPKQDQDLLIKQSRRGLWAGLFFYPKVEYME